MRSSAPVAQPEAVTPPPSPAASSASGRGRIRSVDATRGLVVVVAVFVTAPPEGLRPVQLRHAGFLGLTALDLIFPAFATLFGVGIAMSTRRGIGYRRLLRRTAVLLLVGLAFNAVAAWRLDPATLRVTGVLQLYAVVGFAVVLLSRVLRCWWTALLAAAGVWIGYGVLLAGYARGCPGGVLTPGCNPTGAVTRAVVGAAHAYQGAVYGFDPEGPLTLLSATATVLVGYAAGLLVLRRGRRTAVALVGLGAAVALAAGPLLVLAPVAKRMWTPPFGALSAGAAVALLGLVGLLVDRPTDRRRPATWLFEAFGRNTLLIYFGKGFLAVALARLAVAGVPLDERAIAAVRDFGAGRPWTYALLVLIGWGLLAGGLHARRWYVRA